MSFASSLLRQALAFVRLSNGKISCLAIHQFI